MTRVRAILESDRTATETPEQFLAAIHAAAEQHSLGMAGARKAWGREMALNGLSALLTGASALLGPEAPPVIAAILGAAKGVIAEANTVEDETPPPNPRATMRPPMRNG